MTKAQSGASRSARQRKLQDTYVEFEPPWGHLALRREVT